MKKKEKKKIRIYWEKLKEGLEEKLADNIILTDEEKSALTTAISTIERRIKENS